MIGNFKIFRSRPEGVGQFADAMKAARVSANGVHSVRVPHHSCSVRSMIGALALEYDDEPKPELEVVRVQPGECQLADNGVLILDDLAEWRREVIDAVVEAFGRQAVRLHYIPLPQLDTSAKVLIEIPARFSVYATAQRCPCGLLGDLCRCPSEAGKRYNDRVHSICEQFQEALGSRL